jgi:hypothetical protein
LGKPEFKYEVPAGQANAEARRGIVQGIKAGERKAVRLKTVRL